MILNTITDKVYIGQTNNVRYRWNTHRSHLRSNDGKASPYLQNAWNKYGEKAFVFEVIESNLLDSEADTWERLLISWFREQNLSYNLEDGDNNLKTLSEETKEKLRQANLGKKASEETRKKISKALKGKPHGPMPQEVKDKVSKSKKGVKNPKLASRSKPFSAISPEGEIINGFNHSEFCRQHGLHRSTFSKMLRGEYEHCKGWRRVQ